MIPDRDVLVEDSNGGPGAASPEPASPSDAGGPAALELGHPKLCLFEGERRTLHLEIRNEGQLPAERARLQLSVKGSLPSALAVHWEDRALADRLPLAAGSVVKLPVTVEAVGARGSPADLSDLSLVASLEYLGSDTSGGGVGRRCSFTFAVQLEPMLRMLVAQMYERVPARMTRVLAGVQAPPSSEAGAPGTSSPSASLVGGGGGRGQASTRFSATVWDRSPVDEHLWLPYLCLRRRTIPFGAAGTLGPGWRPRSCSRFPW